MSDERIAAIVEAAIEVLPIQARPPDLENLLCGYLSHLMERNLEVNLVSRRETVRHLERFTRECLFLAALLVEERANAKLAESAPRLLDIGSGGGFPGLVLKIAIPDLEIHMVEGTRKKAQFLADVAAGLDLRETSIVWGRTEELDRAEKLTGKATLRGRCDWVTGKGLGSLVDSTTMAAPFLAAGGVHWTFKGKACAAELEAAGGFFRQRGFAPLRVERIPGSEESFVVGIRKLRR